MSNVASYAKKMLGTEGINMINNTIDTSMLPLVNQQLDETRIPSNLVTKSLSINKLLPVVNAIDPMLPPLDAFNDDAMFQINEGFETEGFETEGFDPEEFDQSGSENEPEETEEFSENFFWGHNDNHRGHNKHRRRKIHRYRNPLNFFRSRRNNEHFTLDRNGVSFTYVDIIVAVLCVLLLWWFVFYGACQQKRLERRNFF